jgi:hypothetical protein
MSKKHTDPIVTTKGPCQELIKVEKTLLLKKVAKCFIVMDIMLENQENLTQHDNVQIKKILALYYEPESLFVLFIS